MKFMEQFVTVSVFILSSSSFTRKIFEYNQYEECMERTRITSLRSPSHCMHDMIVPPSSSKFLFLTVSQHTWREGQQQREERSFIILYDREKSVNREEDDEIVVEDIDSHVFTSWTPTTAIAKGGVQRVDQIAALLSRLLNLSSIRSLHQLIETSCFASLILLLPLTSCRCLSLTLLRKVVMFIQLLLNC